MADAPWFLEEGDLQSDDNGSAIGGWIRHTDAFERMEWGVFDDGLLEIEKATQKLAFVNAYFEALKELGWTIGRTVEFDDGIGDPDLSSWLRYIIDDDRWGHWDWRWCEFDEDAPMAPNVSDLDYSECNPADELPESLVACFPELTVDNGGTPDSKGGGMASGAGGFTTVFVKAGADRADVVERLCGLQDTWVEEINKATERLLAAVKAMQPPEEEDEPSVRAAQTPSEEVEQSEDGCGPPDSFCPFCGNYDGSCKHFLANFDLTYPGDGEGGVGLGGGELFGLGDEILSLRDVARSKALRKRAPKSAKDSLDWLEGEVEEALEEARAAAGEGDDDKDLMYYITDGVADALRSVLSDLITWSGHSLSTDRYAAGGPCMCSMYESWYVQDAKKAAADLQRLLREMLRAPGEER